MSVVVVSDVVKTYLSDSGARKRVLAGIRFEVPVGEVVSIVGSNGSGKSTLLAIIGGMIEPDQGFVTIGGKPPGQARIGFVWQNYRASLLPWLTVEENILFPLRLASVPARERLQRLEQLLGDFGSKLPRKERVYRLSGGQQQMTCLLRALIVRPDVLLLDEPSSALDLQAKWNLFEQIEAIRARNPITTIWVSHDPDEGALAADRILMLSSQSGQMEETYVNDSGRPRSTSELSAPSHVQARNHILRFILQQPAETLKPRVETEATKTLIL